MINKSASQSAMRTQGKCAHGLHGQLLTRGAHSLGVTPWLPILRQGQRFVLSTCLLEGITDSVCNAIPIQWVMFPRKWRVPLKAADAQFGRPPPEPPPNQWDMPALAPPLTGPPTTRPGQEDIHHPKIKLLMDPYLKQYNNFVSIVDIPTASGKRITDLPTLPKYCHPTSQLFL